MRSDTYFFSQAVTEYRGRTGDQTDVRFLPLKQISAIVLRAQQLKDDNKEAA